MVTFRSGLGSKAVLFASIIPVIVVIALVTAIVSDSAVPKDAAVAVLASLAVGLFVVALVVAAAPSHRWDLSRGVVALRGREIRFDEIARVVVFPGFRGWVGMSFWGPARRIPHLGADVSFGTRRALGRNQWTALRALLASPHGPALQAYGPVLPRSMARAHPLRSLRGEVAVRLVDAQIAWIDAGHPSSSARSPIGRFVAGR